MNDGITYQFIGKAKVATKMSELGLLAPRITGAALYTEAEKLMTTIKNEDVPVANPTYYAGIGRTDITPGTLRASGYVKPPAVTPPTGVVVIMGFGGAAQAYAHYQHEGTTWQSGYTKPLVYHGQGHAFYLLKPVQEHRVEFDTVVREAIMSAAEE